jgi:hypothetical protein
VVILVVDCEHYKATVRDLYSLSIISAFSQAKSKRIAHLAVKNATSVEKSKLVEYLAIFFFH